ncbi:MAG: response regulator transcription factor [Actinobacteria bacterium]|nr:response regulator transcription factor [Actinomycetota bacterium]
MLDPRQPAQAGTTILVVEDDPTISDLLAYNLRRAGYAVRQERSGTAGLEAALGDAIALVLLDLMLPGLDGVAAAREIRRRRPTLPVIMLTARDDRETVLRGFEAGADDFVTKPFDMDVLLARIQARLRANREAAPSSAERREVSGGDLKLDPDALRLAGPAGSAALKPKEYGLLELLLSHPGRLFPREELVERVWHQKYLPGSRSLDVHVRRVRRKLGEVGSGAAIETSRGIGYRVRISTSHDHVTQEGPK